MKLQFGNIFQNMSDARETAICSFIGITHILEKIPNILINNFEILTKVATKNQCML